MLQRNIYQLYKLIVPANDDLHVLSQRKPTMTTFTTPEQFVAANKANVETVLSLANSTIARAERLTTLNLNTAHSVLEESAASTKTLLASKNPQELVDLHATLAQPIVEKVFAYASNVYAIAAEGQQEVSKLFEAQIAELNKNFAIALDNAAKSALPGSEPVFAAARSAVEQANTVYDNITKAAKQVAETAEANVAAATSATLKAVSAKK